MYRSDIRRVFERYIFLELYGRFGLVGYGQIIKNFAEVCILRNLENDFDCFLSDVKDQDINLSTSIIELFSFFVNFFPDSFVEEIQIFAIFLNFLIPIQLSDYL